MYQDTRDGRLMKISEATVNRLPHSERQYIRKIVTKVEIPDVIVEKMKEDQLLSMKELKEKYPEISAKNKKQFLKELGYE